MFSGGVDSTMAAIELSKKYDRVHLLTYANGYGHYKIERTKKRADELRRFAGDRFEHTVESVRDLFELFTVDDLLGQYRRYGSGFIWCLGCKMAMHTRSILYNLEHGVREMSDGSSSSTGEMVEQSLLAIYMFREFYAQYGIEFRTPVYEIPREEEIRRLDAMGFRLGLRVGSRFLRVQPKCRAGELYYLPFLLFDQPPLHDEDKVTAFIEEKRAVAGDLIRRRCRALGMELPEGDLR